MKRKKEPVKLNSAVLICFLFALYFLCYFCIVKINRTNGDSTFSLMGGKLILSSCNGILISLQMLICIIYSGMTQKSARMLSIILPLFSITSTSVFIISSKNPEGIPGIMMLVVALIAVTIIFAQIRRRENDALTDYLTGLHNRRSIMKHMASKVKAGKPFGVLYIDIDSFKFINDNYGHETGDLVICTVADRIDSLLDSKYIFGRIGGDEFIILTSGVNNINEICQKVSDAVKQEIVNSETGTGHFITASIGVAKFPDDAGTAAELTKCSDIAMYNVKTSGKNAVMHFNKKFEEALTRKTSIENLAKKYIQDESFTFEYQPQYYADNKTLRGFETLLRIKKEDREMTSIQELVSVAEKSDIIYQIDDYVMKHALAEFRPIALKHGNLLLSVNASARHFSQKGFVAKVRKILEETEFPPECLEIEITEYCLADSLNTTISNMNELKSMGIKIALDDFGTGFASLSYLSKLPVNLLKIDKSFTDELASETKSEKTVDFVNAIISMGHILGCEVISEGVESQYQLDILKEKKCDFIQGFLWGAPISIKMASQLCDKAFPENSR